MKVLMKVWGGQPILSWLFQIALGYLAFLVSRNKIANNTNTIIIAGTLVILIFLSLSIGSKHKKDYK
ncbi:hypothetical protein [Clostridium coskatii]|uniref:Uncharacterized protein n=1 Tax=Clostridium coskatii TaxID=1705578 RepID=A0A166U1E2_9CLOT|nr:hypothetical protein [Clostridium coskatii]OAA94440.1 hypothetical protein WX73_02986 [Clostridium coskatii]OBR93184.1 hypothetical protein CLCOS_26560 [Clostridium coskatii]